MSKFLDKLKFYHTTLHDTDVMWNLKDIFERCAKIGENLRSENPSMMSVGFEALHVVYLISYMATIKANVNDYFDRETWCELFPAEFSNIIVGLFESNKFERISTKSKEDYIKIVDIVANDKEYTIGWGISGNVEPSSLIMCKKIFRDELRLIVRNMLWEKYSKQPILIQRKKVIDHSSSKDKSVDNSYIDIVIDDTIKPQNSVRAAKMKTYLEKCFAAGVNRSQLYYGPPGTGKSTLVRAVAAALNLPTIRIRVEDISTIDSSTITEIVQTFKPDAIIFDDIDRLSDFVHLFEIFEEIKKHVKFIAASANNISGLDSAFLRPGRFDELIYFKQLDEDVIKQILGEANLHLFDQVKDWPIAYIHELNTRMKFMGEAQAVKSLVELQKRIDENDTTCENVKHDIWDDL